MTPDAAYRNVLRSGKACVFPARTDERVRDGLTFSRLFPKFKFEPGSRIFTMGSCFAREIEEKLGDFILPTLDFKAPHHERGGRPNSILNEYNPGTISQRIVQASRGRDFGRDGTIAVEGGYLDLLLPEHVKPCTAERLLERRSQVEATYQAIRGCDVAIVTFGFVEVWFDKQTGIALNRMPPPNVARAEADRYEFRILDINQVEEMIDSMVASFVELGVRKIVLTVSPVAMEATFSGRDCVVANQYSKSVLIACAQRARDRFDEVDYFPSYEIVTSAGASSFEDDGRHVREEVVGAVANYMLDHYVNSAP